MSISRRRFLQTTTVLPASTLYSSSSLACEGNGPGKPNLAPLPEKAILYDGLEDGIEKFLDKTYGKRKWKYSDSPVILRVPNISESPYSISIKIQYSSDSPRYPYDHPYKSLNLYVQRPVYASKTVELCEQGCTYNKSLISWVAKFEFGVGTLREIETRIQLIDSGSFKLIAVFSGWGEKVEVVKQNGVSNIIRCSPELNGYVYGGKSNPL